MNIKQYEETSVRGTEEYKANFEGVQVHRNPPRLSPLVSDVYLMDNIDFMAQFPDKYFDLAVVDPPYGIGVNNNMGRRKGQKSSNYKKAYWDNEKPDMGYFEELNRVSQNQVIWGANHFIQSMSAAGMGTNSPCWLMWDKGFSEDLSFAQFEIAWTSFNSVCKKFERSPNDLNRIHPTQKPVALYDWIFAKYAKPNDKIIDTHLGSGSSRIAANKAGLDFYACELDPDYFKEQNTRYELFVRQLKIF